MTKIFLTGVTGLVGSSFVTALLKDRKDVEFVCMTRGNKVQSAAERVEIALRSQCEFDGEPERIDEVLAAVKVVDGDVVSMNAEALAADPLLKDVSVIFHCAADVNLGKDPTGKTFRINYDGTVNMLDLARRLNVKEFHYVSTAYTAGKTSGVALEAEHGDREFNNPYEESKFKAEKLVRHSGFPFTIYRPAIITGRRSDGRIRKPLAFYRILEFLSKLKSNRCAKGNLNPFDETDLQIHFCTVPSERVYFVPIDYVQYAITKLFQKPVCGETYHVTGDAPVTTNMIDDAVCHTLRLKRVNISPDADANADDALMEKFLGDLFPYFSADIIFSQDNVRKALGDEALNWSYGVRGLEIMMRSFFDDFFPNLDWINKTLSE